MDRREVIRAGGATAIGVITGAVLGATAAHASTDYATLIRKVDHDGTYAFGNLGTALEQVIQNPGDVSLTAAVDDAITDINTWVRDLVNLFNALAQTQH